MRHPLTAPVAELAYAHVSEACGQPCGFKSRLVHHESKKVFERRLLFIQLSFDGLMFQLIDEVITPDIKIRF